MMWEVCCIVFWILCSSEFTVYSQEVYEEIHLSPKDIATNSKGNAQILKVTIKQLKSNPFTHGTTRIFYLLCDWHPSIFSG